MKWADRALKAIQSTMQQRVDQDTETIRESIVDVMRSAQPSGFTDEEGYTSSAPGEPPAYGKGVYAGSWETRAAEVEGMRVRGEVRSDLTDPRTRANVARGLEWGDENSLPRPHIRPGIELARERIRDRARGG